MTFIALLLVVVAIVKTTIDYKGSNLAKAATQRNNCGENLEVDHRLPVQRCAENNSVNSAKLCNKKIGETAMFPRSFLSGRALSRLWIGVDKTIFSLWVQIHKRAGIAKGLPVSLLLGFQ